ncbi:MAG: S1 RNA-binding domain-containing protein [Bacilli bacterium]
MKYKEGDVVSAKVTGIEKYGAFVSIDEEYSGLIHISEITEEFVRDVSDYVEVGDEVKVKIVGLSDFRNQLKLSAKGLNNNLKKNGKKKIKETVFGFYLLKSALPNWIEEKMAEFNKKN